MGTVDLVVGILLVSLFYGTFVSLLLPYFPGVTNTQLAVFTNEQGVSKIATIQYGENGLEQGLKQQSTIPLLDFGTLIFYSSITALNVFANVITAIPQMLTILLTGILMLLHVPNDIAVVAKLGFIGIFTTLGMFAMLIFIISTRSPTYGGIK